MAVLKVKDLPQDEKDKLVAEAQELDIRGLLDNYGVETLKAKIAEKKAQQNGGQDAGEQQENDGEQSKDAGENEQDGGNDEQNGSDYEQSEDENEQDAENANNNETQTDEAMPDGGSEKEEKDDLYSRKTSDVKICHICRSKVIDGKCTGCGFSV